VRFRVSDTAVPKTSGLCASGFVDAAAGFVDGGYGEAWFGAGAKTLERIEAISASRKAPLPALERRAMS